MIKNRFNYWTCSKFADFVRGEKKPFALEWGAWDEWKKEQKKKRPIRFWLSDTFLGYLQDIVYYPYDIYNEIRHYVCNRWVDKTHFLKTGLKPGHYYELDKRILYGLFNELVDFVEMDLSHLSKYNRDKKYHFKNGRCIEAAHDYFEWAANLKYDEDWMVNPEDNRYGELTNQAKAAIKIKELYEWWTKIRPLRDDPWITINRDSHGENYFEAIAFVEDYQYNEDTEMLIKLIRLRRELWI